MEAEPPKADPPKRKRRWFQFSLQTLLILVIIVAIPCAFLGRKLERKRIERAVVQEIVGLGGWAGYDEVDEQQRPLWLRNLLGEHFFSEVVSSGLGPFRTCRTLYSPISEG